MMSKSSRFGKWIAVNFLPEDVALELGQGSFFSRQP